MTSNAPSPGPTLVLVPDPPPWYATTPTTTDERRRDLEDEHSRLLVQAVCDHPPFELAVRAAELAAQLGHSA